MEAHNRKLENWYGKINRGEIKLPRFQRHEAWDKQRIVSLIETIIHDLPLGITLVLEVDTNNEKFIPRFLETAPHKNERVLEQLLDGQQRLTALWRTFHNNYELKTFYVYIKEFDQYEQDQEREDMSVFCRGRYYKRNGYKYPLWCDEPHECLKRGLIPTDLLKPEDIQSEIDQWITESTKPMHPKEDIQKIEEFWKYRNKISEKITNLRTVVSKYNLPFLSLTSETNKSVALNVFINMNTNSKPLSTYDIIVAEVESVMGRSIHDLQSTLHKESPNIAKYSELSDLILTTSALLQDKLPNQRGAWDMDKRTLVNNWDKMKVGLNRMADFLQNEGIFDRQRLPTNAVLAVIAALYAYIPISGDKRGNNENVLKKYLWFSFFSDRYENSAATHAYADFLNLRKLIKEVRKNNNGKYDLSDVPIFKEHQLVEQEELINAEWPKRSTILGRAIQAVTCKLGALDFSTGEKLSPNNIEYRQYHHIFPNSLLKEAEIESFRALNCALISDKTNITIGRKDPLEYLKDRYEWTTKDIVYERLKSHLIPVDELANGGYEGLSKKDKQKKLQIDFDKFVERRAELITAAVDRLTKGKELDVNEIFNH